jgi:hypothetical protein
VAKIRAREPQTKEEMDEIFENTLRPLQSRNARHIFMILRDSETEHLTTYDMQPVLEEQGNELSKVELNNWLSQLQDVGLVNKAPDRGKPTSRPYNRRYTFDLWKLTQKGRETSHKLEIFRGNTHIQTIEKTIEKTLEVPKLPELEETCFEDQEKIQALSINLLLLKILSDNRSIDLLSLSEKTGLTSEKIVEFIDDQEKSSSNTLYLLTEIPLDLWGKIMQTFGQSPRKKYKVFLNSEGERILSLLSS